MGIAKGIQLLEEIVGTGPEASKGDRVVYNARMFLRRGDEITRDKEIIAGAREHLTIRYVDGVELIDHATTLGSRRVIAGVEKALLGMKAGGFRKVLVSPHLAYGEEGVPELVPPNALLNVHLWVRYVENP